MAKFNSLTIYCQHGDERFGAIVAEKLHKVSYPALLGNPKAFLAGKRFVESDLNRSYKTIGIKKTYEEKRAQHLIKEAKKYDLVIDVHSSRAKVGKVAIVASDKLKLLRTAADLGFDKVVVMPKSIAKLSLIGNIENGISLEYGSNVPQSEKEAKALAKRITGDFNASTTKNLAVYYVKSKLPMRFRGTGLRNYRYSDKIHGYPFLVGESRYKTYAGFLADRLKTVSIDRKEENG